MPSTASHRLHATATTTAPSMRCPPLLAGRWWHPKSAYLLIIVLAVCTLLLAQLAFRMDSWGSRSGVTEDKAGPLQLHQVMAHRRRPDDEIDPDTLERNLLGNSPMNESGAERGGTKTSTDLKGDGSSLTSKEQLAKVVELLKVSKSSEASPAENRRSLRPKIDLLRKAFVDPDTMLDTVASVPTCKGDLKDGEVEDLLCIPRPDYLPNLKNPCWYAKPESHPKGRSQLRCLPYFHILGIAKSGTTDLWNRLTVHPHMVKNNGLLKKEALWWSWRRFGISSYKRWVPQTFNHYIDLFKDTANGIQQSLEEGSSLHKMLITGDASPPDFWDFRGWMNISQNRGLESPQVVTPHLMKHFYQNPKFVLLFKDPIDRMYSDYFFVGGGLTSRDFHEDLIRSIHMLSDCVRDVGIRCFYNQSLYMKLPLRLPYACYSVYLREWLRVFPRENFLFLKTENYEAHPEDTLKAVMRFLGLRVLKDEELQEIAEEEKSRVTQQKRIAGPMKKASRYILSQLLEPCGKALVNLTGSSEFSWPLGVAET